SMIAITLYGVGNAPVVGSYRVALALTGSNQQWIASPAWSAFFDLVADELADFSLFPKNVQSVAAGNVIHFYVETADQYGNLVSLDDVDWEVIGAPDVAGVISDGDFQAMYTGRSRVVASYEQFADTSSFIFVVAGGFAYLRMEGGALTSVAGEPWQDNQQDITVTAYDMFGNVKLDFSGDVYFAGTDPHALLPATAASPYQFTGADQGVHIFKGSEFTFFKAGRHDLDLLTDTILQQTLAAINVEPNVAVTFQFTLPDSVIAGATFTISVTDAVDNWDNLISGEAAVELTSGSGISPSGTCPVLAPFLIADGAGDGQAILVKGGQAQIKVSVAGLNRSGILTVHPAALESFDFDLDQRQVAGQPFIGTATLTALDNYRNIITRFDASDDTVTITSSGSGTMFNNVIGSSAAFTDGVCDLTAPGTGYSGSELAVAFTATSQSGKTGVSPLVEFAAVKITAGWLEAETKYIGEDYHFLLTITNFSSHSVTIEQIGIYADDQALTPQSIDPILPATIPALDNRTWSLIGSVPDSPGQTLDIAAAFSGSLVGDAVFDLVGNLAELTILAPEGISIVAGSLTPTQVTINRAYSFAVTLRNDSHDDLTLQTDTKLRLGDTLNPIALFDLPSPSIVTADGGQTELTFGTHVFPDVAAGTINEMALLLQGMLGSVAYQQELAVDGIILAQTVPTAQYQQGSFTPTTIYRGSDVAFSLDIINSGTAELSITTAELALYASGRQVRACLSSGIDVITNGVNTLQFDALFIPTDFPTTIDSIVSAISGWANGHSESLHLSLAGNMITVPVGAAVALVQSEIDALNPPWVNIGQAFTISGTVANQGDETLKDIVVRMISNGVSSFTDSVKIAQLAVDAETTTVFPVLASMMTGSELFSLNVESAYGYESGLPAAILPPINNTQPIIIQTPASLSLSARISDPPEAQDGIIEPATEFTISAVVINSGMAATGSGELTLQLSDPDFTTNDPLMQTFTVGSEISWEIKSPDHIDTLQGIVTITTIPLDQNSGVSAKIIADADTDTFTIRISEVLVEIEVDFMPLDIPLLSAGGTYEVLAIDFHVTGEAKNPYLLYLDIFFRNNQDNLVDPAGLIASAQLLYNDQYTRTGTNMDSPDRIRFDLGPSLGIPETGLITLTLIDNPLEPEFSLYLDSTSFAARYQAAGGEKEVGVTERFASNLLVEQSYNLVPSQFEQAFFCYPN
ncbi:MAG: hypothetical protein KAT58_12685, partial [candidate division Zixibacteria bacterium]|nr:hypothetical protein [candidate division Zixibacteria bacterium]